jgi:hypothetical protein
MGLHFRPRNSRPLSVVTTPPPWRQHALPRSAPRIEGTPEPFPATPRPAHDRLFFWLSMLGTAAAGAVYLSH